MFLHFVLCVSYALYCLMECLVMPAFICVRENNSSVIIVHLFLCHHSRGSRSWKARSQT